MAERKSGRSRDLGDAIRRARTLRRMTQIELGQDAGGYSESYIAHIERGARRPTDKVLRGIAEALHIDYNDLAALAGYIDKPTGDVTLQVSPDWARRIRRAMSYAGEQVDKALDTLEIWYHPDLAGIDRAEQEADEEAEREAEQDGPDNAQGAGSGS